MRLKFHEAVGAFVVVVALGAVVYAAVLENNTEALGALLAVVSAGVNFFLRAKVQSPSNTS